MLLIPLVLCLAQSSIRVPARIPQTFLTGDAPDLQELRAQGNALFRAGSYLKAVEVYQHGYREARKRGLTQSAVRFLNNLGGAHRQMFRYRDAIQVYLDARDLAIFRGDREAWGALCMNLSSVYLQMGNVDAALTSASQGLSLPREVTAKYRPLLLIQAALSTWQKNRSPQALTMLYQAIDSARSQLDTAVEAQAWNELGNTLLEDGRLAEADRALGEAYRLRILTRNDRIPFTYESLGKLRMRQGDPESAAHLFDRALESASSASPPDAWAIYYERGRLRQEQGRLAAAYADFGAALECARRWRAEILPADSFRVSADVSLHQVYASYIELADRFYRQTGDRRYAEAAFSATEGSRAASLRALWAGSDLTRKLPDEYWEALAGLHHAEIAMIQDGPAGDAAAVRARRVHVAEIEARAGLDLPVQASDYDSASAGILERTRLALQSDEAFLGFHLGDEESYLWVVAREGFSLRRLPSGTQIGEEVRAFGKAIRESSPGMPNLARHIYAELFGGGEIPLLRKSRWVVAPDGPLFELPFAALIEPLADGASAFLVKGHAVRIVPGSWALSGGGEPEWRSLAVGLGDPVYNRADPRAEHPTVQRTALFHKEDRSAHLELARLAGSSREIESCARIWRSHGTETLLLRGPDATRNNFTRALEQSPAVVHVAAHLLFPPEPTSPGMLALTIGAGHNVELLSAEEIASMRLKVGLVVLNGCYSARAAALPGAGLMGMTRAWLAAGARAVIVTRWSTSDQDEGRLFQSFYERMSASRGPVGRRWYSDLLREAQLDELGMGGPRANPAHWASYFCVERH